MPGILPMKVIKVGGGSQSRVAQACDRCRSKKIRCDGVRPCCSQCANVGFECKTSDKLSRRAFPRGYTESLEDRVRSLEAEVHELKCLLDEKDEKIDVLSRLHDMHPSSKKPPSPASTKAPSVSSASSGEDSNSHSTSERDDLIHVQHATSLLRKPSQSSPFSGPSSTSAFIDAFAHKLESNGKPSSSISADSLLAPPPSSVAWQLDSTTPKAPPRLVSDQLLNIFFQEWAPLYPVVHRPSILKLYSRYTANPDSIEDDKYGLAQLNLIFGIAAISSTSRVPQDPALFERNWSATLESLSHDNSLAALQCYILAQIFYSIKSDYKSVLRYRGIAVAICLQLGLHQSHKRFSFNTLINETRKKVFWCQYVLDRFTAALTGLPILISESDICTEYPADIDDENVTETGFVPTLPDETTRLSSALALINASRILNKVLEQLYPSPAGYKLSLSTIHSLAEELDEWQKKLPSHLRLDFVQDKPSTSTTGSRSPLLSIIYYFIRALIRRPAVCFGQPGSSSPSILSLVDSAKHIIQILKLLEERRMSLSITVSKRELVFIAGLGLLWQSLDLNSDSKLVKEGQKLLSSGLTLLECEAAETAAQFGALVHTVTGFEEGMRRKSTEGDSSARVAGPRSKSKSPENLRAKVPNSQNTDILQNLSCSSQNTAIATSAQPPSTVQCQGPLSASSDQSFHTSAIPFTASDQYASSSLSKLDFLQFENCKSDWESILSDIEAGHSNIYNGIYGGSECGEPPAAFASINSAAPLFVPPSQPRQQQGRPSHHHQQSQQHAVLSNQPPLQTPTSAGDSDGWTPENWSDTVINGLQSTPIMLNGMVYSEDGFPQGDGLPCTQRHGVHHESSPSDVDHVRALMMPQTLDPLDRTADFNSSAPDGSWAPQPAT